MGQNISVPKTNGTNSRFVLSAMYCPYVRFFSAYLVLIPARRKRRGMKNGLKNTIKLLIALLGAKYM